MNMLKFLVNKKYALTKVQKEIFQQLSITEKNITTHFINHFINHFITHIVNSIKWNNNYNVVIINFNIFFVIFNSYLKRVNGSSQFNFASSKNIKKHDNYRAFLRFCLHTTLLIHCTPLQRQQRQLINFSLINHFELFIVIIS